MKKDKGSGLVPRLRFSEFKNESRWGVTTLGNVATFASGGTPSKDVSEYWNGHIPWISASSMYDTNIRDSQHKVTDIAIGNGTRIAKAGSLLILTRGSMLYNRVPMGIALIDVAFNQDVRALTIDTSVSTSFLMRQLTAQEYRIPINDTGIGAGKIDTEDLRRLPVAIPSSAEQQKIADCLGSLDDLIAAEGRKLEALRQHKQGLMQQLFPRPGETAPRLRFPEFRGEGEWKGYALGEIAEISKGKGISKSDIVEGGRTPCIRYGELYTSYGEIIEIVKSRTNLPASDLVLSNAGDVIIPASGETKEDIATCACVVDDGVAIGSDLNIIRSAVDGRFFSYYLNGSRRRELAKVAQGDTVTHLYPTQLLRLEVYIPEAESEQQRIADCLSSLDTGLAAQAHKIDDLKTHKQGLLQQLFPSLEGQ